MKRLLPLLLLAGCTKTIEVPVVKEVVREVKVPVHTPCIKDRPDQVQALRDKVGRAEWDALTTDQRNSLLLAQGQDRQAFSEKLTVATVGCV